MYVYDRANLLAQDIKEMPDLKRYKELKEKIAQDEMTKNLIKNYKNKQFKAQSLMMAGEKVPDSDLEEIRKLGEVLFLNKDVAEYFAVEYRLQTIIGDIYKIIGEAVEFDTDFMEE